MTTGTIEQFKQVVNSIHSHRRIRIADNNGKQLQFFSTTTPAVDQSLIKKK